MNETWKDVVGYEGFYQVSDAGKIRSLSLRKNAAEYTLKPGTDGGGYQIVTLCQDGGRATKTVHRLIMEAFAGSSLLDVNHIDGNKANNALANLEYCSKKHNIQHALRMGLLRPNTKAIAESKRKAVLQLDAATGQQVARFNSAHEAARLTGTNRGNLSAACREAGKIVAGFRWQYVPQSYA